MNTVQAPAVKRRRITGMPYHQWNEEQDFMLSLCLALQCTTQSIIEVFAKCYKVTLRSSQLNSRSQTVKKRTPLLGLKAEIELIPESRWFG